uniref:Uncharacterized protein n=1 Tax=Tanacetum cinerariifolium TaxID=118510 RepID=A0A699H6Z8_TANCI|nr:hypothetical protein [Tanacetum cinerariifolium]
MKNYQYWLLITPSGWSFVSAVPSQMTHLVASITLDSARSCVMQGAFLTQGMVSSIPSVLSSAGSIRPKGFRPSILLLTVIIVTVAIVVVVVLVIVDTIIGIVVVVGAPSIIKLAFVITAKDDIRNAYEKCTDISQESCALIDTFLKKSSDKDYELNLSMYGNAAKLEKQMDAKLAWQLKKYYCRSQTHIGDVYLTGKELHQLYLDGEALRETLEEQAMDEKAHEEKIRQK